MDAATVLRLVDTIHRDKNIDKDTVFEAIETGVITAARKQYGELAEIEIHIDRASGQMTGSADGTEFNPHETIGRIGAQTAKQVIIQKIRERERDSLFDRYHPQIGTLMNGTVLRFEGNKAIVSIPPQEAILPRSEQIPGESYHPNDRVRAVLAEVRKQGSRVALVLSRTRNELVRRLFEQEIPEIADGIIEIKSVAREVGYRAKVAVYSNDERVDCVGACVGQRGARIKSIVDELGGERIDIVRWSEDVLGFIMNALQPAEVDEVILCQMMGRAIVLVGEDQLSLAIGRRGQNVRLATRLCGWDIEIMTRDELEEQIDQAVNAFSQLAGMSDTLAERLVGEGFLSYDDLSVIEPDDLMAMGELTAEQVDSIVTQAEALAELAEREAAEQRRRAKEQDSAQRAQASQPGASLESLLAGAAAEQSDAESSSGEGDESGDGEELAEGEENAGGDEGIPEFDDTTDDPTPDEFDERLNEAMDTATGNEHDEEEGSLEPMTGGEETVEHEMIHGDNQTSEEINEEVESPDSERS